MNFDIEIYFFVILLFSLLFYTVRLKDRLKCKWCESVTLSQVKLRLEFHPKEYKKVR